LSPQAHTALEQLSAALEVLTGSAHEVLRAKDDAWRPLAARLVEWVGLRRQVESDSDDLNALKAASSWMKNNRNDLRNARLLPLADKAREIWSMLRQESNADLGAITLQGERTRRHVVIGATVDGAEPTAADGALTVMSQGELHALALSLFLPKALSPHSPFGFLVIDDPVQAMDPAKVDGLAKVLAQTARERQVIVFTHDDRLAEAVRRLDLDATLLEVTREKGSVVTVSATGDSSLRYLDDARALAKDERVTDEVKVRVVPSLCRMAVENRCRGLFYARRIRDGASRRDVERDWEDGRRTRTKIALALGLDDENAVSQWINSGQRRVRAMRAVGSGSHGKLKGTPLDAVADVKTLIADLEAYRGR
jgi:ATPase subunit of ABC transporter with duplicated ATPase domains